MASAVLVVRNVSIIFFQSQFLKFSNLNTLIDLDAVSLWLTFTNKLGSLILIKLPSIEYNGPPIIDVEDYCLHKYCQKWPFAVASGE